MYNLHCAYGTGKERESRLSMTGGTSMVETIAYTLANDCNIAGGGEEMLARCVCVCEPS